MAGKDGDEEENANSMLLKCLDSGRIDVLCSILSQLKQKPNFQETLDAVCCEEGTLLHRAVQIDSVDAVCALLVNGSNACVQSNEGKTPFNCCKSDGARNAFVQEALRAITLGNVNRLCQLIWSGLPVDSVDTKESANTLLNWAADFSTPQVVQSLCENGASVNQENVKGETPLITAVKKDNEEVCRVLLSAGADPYKKTNKGEDAFAIAKSRGGKLLGVLSMDRVVKELQRTKSVESIDDRMSLISNETATAQLFTERYERFADGVPESWTDLLWPQPKLVRMLSGKGFELPKDNKLKIYFDESSSADPRRLMQIIEMSKVMLHTVGIEVEYRGHKTSDHESSPSNGKVTCGIFNDGRPCGAYTLTIESKGVEIIASDYAGVRYAFSTLVQIVRLHSHALHQVGAAVHTGEGNGAIPAANANSHSLKPVNGNNSLNDKVSGDSLASSNSVLPGINTDGTICALTVRDSPDRSFRAVFQDFSGCRILNKETVMQLATRLSYCKANYFFVNFEVRTTDRYQLPYTNRELFHMLQVCDELFMTLVPSLDTQTNYLEPYAAKDIIEQFLDDFPLSKIAHFGPNLSSILIENRKMLSSIQRRVPRIFLSIIVDDRNLAALSSVPPYVTLCVEGSFPFDIEKKISPRVSLVLKFSSGDDGYLCASPESTAKKALLASKLSDRAQILGSMICDLSTGCEAMPPSLSYTSLLASVGVAWNRETEMKKFSFLLPTITAHHMLLAGNMSALFEQVSTLGRVEHQITKFAYGMWRPAPVVNSPGIDLDDKINFCGPSKSMPISVFVEIILNPENLNLERLTPVVFKKARIELRRSLQALDKARKLLPYNFELALVLAEIKLVTELMVLASKLGQSMCMYGSIAAQQQSQNGDVHGKKLSYSEGMPYSPGRVGVVQLPLTVRTDLANSLLEIRSQFQHVWLSRSMASTLPNALKMFDNLFRALLPPDLQEMGKQLL